MVTSETKSASLLAHGVGVMVGTGVSVTGTRVALGTRVTVGVGGTVGAMGVMGVMDAAAVLVSSAAAVCARPVARSLTEGPLFFELLNAISPTISARPIVTLAQRA